MAEKLNSMASINVLIEDVEDNVKDFCGNFYGNESDYLSDAIMEWADGNVNIYYSDIDEYLSEHIFEVNDIIDEYGWDGVGRDIRKAAQLAQCRTDEDDLFSQKDEIWKHLAYEYLRLQERKEVPAELIEEIEGWAETLDINDRIWCMSDNIDEWFSDHEEEEEEEDE